VGNLYTNLGFFLNILRNGKGVSRCKIRELTYVFFVMIELGNIFINYNRIIGNDDSSLPN
jgi:hypothetical protein